MTGVGWALARLALATGDTRFADAARAAFSFEETLYDPAADGWADLRDPDEGVFSAAWCHGDLDCWELFDDALTLGRAPAGLDRRGLDARIITSVEDNGPAGGPARDAYCPGMLAGLGGMAYRLLRLHSDSDLPSVLKPD
ncbi:hypothetical protein NE234_07650 [Actinoallomurus sp. WRP9H-5]|nr:hypothetical protein [Actinoallomurus rhizosphaericola]